MFQGEAEHWWEMVKGGAKSAGKELTWNFLVKKFNEKYIPGVAKDKLAMKFQELKLDRMSASQYDIKFTQLSRYVAELVREEADRTKRFIRGLRPKIRCKLVPFQLQNYVQAVEKALEVERDIMEDQEVPGKEFPPSKRFRYQETHGSGGLNLNLNRDMGSSVVPVSRYHGGSENRGGFLPRPQLITPPHLKLTRNSWCPRYNRNHMGNCFQGRQCFTCGNIGHIRKECPILHGYPMLGYGAERRVIGTTPFSGSHQSSRRPSNTNRLGMTQSLVQQPRAQGKMNALTQEETRVSNALVEGIIRILEHTARVLFNLGDTHSFVSTAFASKLNKKPELLKFQLFISTSLGAE